MGLSVRRVFDRPEPEVARAPEGNFPGSPPADEDPSRQDGRDEHGFRCPRPRPGPGQRPVHGPWRPSPPLRRGSPRGDKRRPGRRSVAENRGAGIGPRGPAELVSRGRAAERARPRFSARPLRTLWPRRGSWCSDRQCPFTDPLLACRAVAGPAGCSGPLFRAGSAA
jgi:hypothetical protein